jgi:hypothetical protein
MRIVSLGDGSEKPAAYAAKRCRTAKTAATIINMEKIVNPIFMKKAGACGTSSNCLWADELFFERRI